MFHCQPHRCFVLAALAGALGGCGPWHIGQPPPPFPVVAVGPVSVPVVIGGLDEAVRRGVARALSRRDLLGGKGSPAEVAVDVVQATAAAWAAGYAGGEVTLVLRLRLVEDGVERSRVSVDGARPVELGRSPAADLVATDAALEALAMELCEIGVERLLLGVR